MLQDNSWLRIESHVHDTERSALARGANVKFGVIDSLRNQEAAFFS